MPGKYLSPVPCASLFDQCPTSTSGYHHPPSFRGHPKTNPKVLLEKHIPVLWAPDPSRCFRREWVCRGGQAWLLEAGTAMCHPSSGNVHLPDLHSSVFIIHSDFPMLPQGAARLIQVLKSPCWLWSKCVRLLKMRAGSSAGIDGAAFLPTLETAGQVWNCSVQWMHISSWCITYIFKLYYHSFLVVYVYYNHIGSVSHLQCKRPQLLQEMYWTDIHLHRLEVFISACPSLSILWHTSGHTPERRVTGSVCPIAWWFAGKLVREVGWFRRTDTEN